MPTLRRHAATCAAIVTAPIWIPLLLLATWVLGSISDRIYDSEE
jgi:hypothetical protein